MCKGRQVTRRISSLSVDLRRRHVPLLALLFLSLNGAFGQEGQPVPDKHNPQQPPQRPVAAWPGFRGAGGIGQAVNVNPPADWNANGGKNTLWKTALPKHGMSSPVVWHDRLFLTGADETSRQVYCVDASTGRLNWTHDVNDLPDAPAGGTLPQVLDETGYAAPSPITDGKYVAAIFGTGELVCLNFSGKRQWSKHLGIPANHYGHASSLISHGKNLYVQYDQRENSRLLAFDLEEGSLLWQVARSAISWSSPIIIDNGGRSELVLSNSKSVDSYDLATGRHLWHVDCLGGEVAPSPAYADGIVFVANDGVAATAISIRNHEKAATILWQWKGDLPDISSPVANDKFLLLPTSFGVVTCLDTKLGKVLWEHEFDVGFSSSPIIVQDRVYLVDLSGVVHILKLGDRFEPIAQCKMGEAVYATPAFAGNRVFVRGLSQVYCIHGKPE
jgi:outer membrane protein assembly factor BamB